MGAIAPIRTAMPHFPREFRAHVPPGKFWDWSSQRCNLVHSGRLKLANAWIPYWTCNAQIFNKPQKGSRGLLSPPLNPPLDTKCYPEQQWKAIFAWDWNKSFTHTYIHTHPHLTPCRSSWPQRVWWTKYQSLLLNIYFRLSGFHSSLLLSGGTGEGARGLGLGLELGLGLGLGLPIRYVTFHFRTRRVAPSFCYKIRAEITVVMGEQKTFSVWFLCWGKS